MYKSLIRPLLFCLDSERAHDLAFLSAKIARPSIVESLLGGIFGFSDQRLETSVFGVEFKNPIGLAAGFDKQCAGYELLSALGFGSIELGTVTAQPQSGNPRPRIFRYPKDSALINRMGFPSSGADLVVSNIKRVSGRARHCRMGINIGKTKVVPIQDAHKDYAESFEKLKGLGDYFVINVSSPNTPELRTLQERSKLSQLFSALQSQNSGKKPILVKIAPDLSFQEIDDVIECSLEHGIAGIIATNTTSSRQGLTTQTDEVGGLSGAPLLPRALEVVSYISRRTDKKFPIIGVGGIFNAADALRMFEAGASLIQIYTALIYEGPFIVQRMKRELLRLMEERGVGSIAELIGVKNGK